MTMPQYAILEIATVSHPQFDDLDSLKTEIEQKTVHTTAKILRFLLDADEAGVVCWALKPAWSILSRGLM